MESTVGSGIPVLGVAAVMIPAVLVSIVGMALWIWMLIDCITKEPSEGNDKIVWILVIVLVGWLGALIYLLARRPKRMAEYGQ